MDTLWTKLSNRGLIHIEGEDRHDFLQNLVTNDLDLLETQKNLYACLLTPQGKFLHDFFIREGNGVLLLDCEGGDRAQDLYKRLNLYRLRAKVKISVEEHNDVYALWNGQSPTALPDPRHPDMGARCFEKPEAGEEKPFAFWDERRIRLTIPDGCRDMIPEQSTLDEAHMDRLNAVSYEKGCYIGQELTARMHHRGLGKKHLYTIEGENMPEPGTRVEVTGKVIGEMRSSCGQVGIALLKDEDATRDALPFNVL